MKYLVKYTSKFRKDIKKIQKRGYKISILSDVVKILANGEKLPQKNCDHELQGVFQGFRECHVAADWLLVYQYLEESLVLRLMRTGTHSDLF